MVDPANDRAAAPAARPVAWGLILLTYAGLLTALRSYVYLGKLHLPPLAFGGSAEMAALTGLVFLSIVGKLLLLWVLARAPLPAPRLRQGLAGAAVVFYSLYVCGDCLCQRLGGISLDFFIGFIPEALSAPGQTRTAVGNSLALATPIVGMALAWAVVNGLIWKLLGPRALTCRRALAVMGVLALLSLGFQGLWRNPNEELNAHLELGSPAVVGELGYLLRQWWGGAARIVTYEPEAGLTSARVGVDVSAAWTGPLEVGLMGGASAPLTPRNGHGEGTLAGVDPGQPWAALQLRGAQGRVFDERAVRPTAVVSFAGSRFDPHWARIFASLRDPLRRYWERGPHQLDIPLLARSACQDQPPHVVVVMLESLRREQFNAETMPELWELSRQGVVLDQHYAATNCSHQALFAILAARSALFYSWGIKNLLVPYLPKQMKDFGYTVGHWGSTPQMGWKMLEVFINPRVFSVLAVPREDTTEFTEVPGRDAYITHELPNVLAHAKKPQFIYVWLNSTHFPYGWLPPYDVYKPVGEGVTFSNIFTLDRQIIVNRYKNSCRFLDHCLAQMVRELDMSKTVVILTGDHGESLGENGNYSHGTRACDPQLLVPCIILGPGVPAGKRVQTNTSHLDIAATVMHLVCKPGQSPNRVGDGYDALGEPVDRVIPMTTFRTNSPYELVLQWNKLRLLVQISCFNLFSRADLGPTLPKADLNVIGPLGADGSPDFSIRLEDQEWLQFRALVEKL